MALVTVPFGTLVITSGQAVSNILDGFEDSVALSIYAPAILTDTIVVYTEPSSSGTNFQVHQSGTVDIALTADRATTLSPVTFMRMRLRSCGTETGTRTFRLVKSYVT